MIKKIVVVGIGYVGLPLAIMLARSGFRVIGVDVKKDLITNINNGIIPLTEVDINRLIQEPQVKANFHAQEEYCEADVFIVSVPTALDERKRIADLSQVIDAVESIVLFLRPENLVIIESTIPPLTCRGIIKPVLEKSGLKIGEDIFLAHCPERILPGDLFKEIVHNDRVIGGFDEKSAQMAKEIYASFVKGELYITDDVTAELVKLMENTYRDINIAFANEFAAVAETLGVNITQAIKLANKHPRVKILKPGIGTGGHCIPVDPWFIHQVDPSNSRLIYTARMINEEVPLKIAAKIRRAVKGIDNAKIITLGVTYKPNTYDIRNSPALRIIKILKEEGYYVEAYDPIAEGYSYRPIKELAKGADCLVVLVEHEIIRDELDREEEEIKQAMRHPIIVRFYPEGGEKNDRQKQIRGNQHCSGI